MDEKTTPEASFVKVESSTDNNSDNVPRKQPNIGRVRGRGGGRGGFGRQFNREADYSNHYEGQKKFHGNRFNRYQDNQSQDDCASMDSNSRFKPRGIDEKINEKVQQMSGPTFDLPPMDSTEKKFNSRNRLYIGNVGGEITEQDLEEKFKSYGETAEIFINKEKNFAFIKLDYHCNAEKAKKELDGTILKSRNLKIRFAPNTSSVKIKNLTPFVSNELLLYAFSVFGEIERATVCVDERGKPTGEGIIDFCRKGSALQAIRKCSENCFFLTSSLRPCILEFYEHVDDNDGFSEKSIPKRGMDYQNEREQGPRFAKRGSFEDEFGMRWKQLFDLHGKKEEALKKELELEKEKLAAQMQYVRYEHETEVLRDQLRAREVNKEQKKRDWEFKQRQLEQEHLRTEELMRRSQEEMESRISRQQEEIKRRQNENNLFVQAHNLDSLLDIQEKAYDPPEVPDDYEQTECTGSNVFTSSYSRSAVISRYPAENGGVWVTDSSRQKRRRF